MSKIVFLDGRKVSAPALLHSVAENSELDGVVILARRDGKWGTCWSSGLTLGGLCMASMKLDHDLKTYMHEGATAEDEPDKAS